MATGNNRKENTFKQKASSETVLLEEQPIITEEPKKEEKPKKETSKKNEKSQKGKDSKPQKTKEKPKSESRFGRIVGILFLCLAVFLGIALISYLVSFFSGHHQEYGYQIFSKKIEIENRTNQDVECLEMGLTLFGMDAIVLRFHCHCGIKMCHFRWRCRLVAQHFTDKLCRQYWCHHHSRIPIVGFPCLPIQPHAQLFQGAA